MTKDGYDNTLHAIGQAIAYMDKLIHTLSHEYEDMRLLDKWTWLWKESGVCHKITEEDKMIGYVAGRTLKESMELG